jgi:type I restriction enzyme M protein
MDRSKDKIGYEVPFTRLFYKFEQPESSDDIFDQIKELGREEAELMKALFN